MTAYLLDICKSVANRKALEDYWRALDVALERSSAKMLSGYAELDRLEGNFPVEGVMLMEFPSFQEGKDWFYGPANQAALKHRAKAAQYLSILADGGRFSNKDDRMPHTRGNRLTPEELQGRLRAIGDCRHSQEVCPSLVHRNEDAPAYLLYVCHGVFDRSKLEDYWAAQGPTYAHLSAAVLSSYQKFERLDGDDPVDGAVLAIFPKVSSRRAIDTTREWFHGAAYTQARRHRNIGCDYLGMVSTGEISSIAERMPRTSV